MKIVTFCVLGCFVLVAHAIPHKKLEKLVSAEVDTPAPINEAKTPAEDAKTEKREVRDLKVTGEASDSEKLGRAKKQATTFCVEIKPAPAPHIHVSCDGNTGGLPSHPHVPLTGLVPGGLAPNGLVPGSQPSVINAPGSVSPPAQKPVICDKELVPYFYQPPRQVIYIEQERCRPVGQTPPAHTQVSQTLPPKIPSLYPGLKPGIGLTGLKPIVPGLKPSGAYPHNLACNCHYVLTPGANAPTGWTNEQLARDFLQALGKNGQNGAQLVAQAVGTPIQSANVGIQTAPQVIHTSDCPVHNQPQVQVYQQQPINQVPNLNGLYGQPTPSELQQTDDCFGQPIQGQRIGRVPDPGDLQHEKDKQRQITGSVGSADLKKIRCPEPHHGSNENQVWGESRQPIKRRSHPNASIRAINDFQG